MILSMATGFQLISRCLRFQPLQVRCILTQIVQQNYFIKNVHHGHDRDRRLNRTMCSKRLGI